MSINFIDNNFILKYNNVLTDGCMAAVFLKEYIFKMDS